MPSSSAQAEVLPLPHGKAAEQALLGGILASPDIFEDVGDLLEPEHFHFGEHRLIFASVKAVAEAGRPITAVHVSEHLANHGKLDRCGGMEYLLDLESDAAVTSDAVALAKTIRGHANRRALIRLNHEIAELAARPGDLNDQELLHAAEERVYALSEKSGESLGAMDVNVLLGKAIDKMEEQANRGDALSGMSTGFDDIDEKIDGLRGGQLIVVGGRPAMGKTTFAMNIAEHAAYRLSAPAAVFSLEMPGEELMFRSMASMASVPLSAVRSGRATEEESSRLADAISQMRDKPLFVIDESNLTVAQIRAEARRLKRKHDLKLIVIDYLQLISTPPSSGRQNRSDVIGEISRALKLLARELDIPVILLSQLNRELEKRPNKRPVMSDLRESGAIEQDADLIVFVYRDEVYNPDSEDRGVGEAIIGKQRNGPIGTVRLSFEGQYTRYTNLREGSHEGLGGDFGEFSEPCPFDLDGETGD